MNEIDKNELMNKISESVLKKEKIIKILNKKYIFKFQTNMKQISIGDILQELRKYKRIYFYLESIKNAP